MTNRSIRTMSSALLAGACLAGAQTPSAPLVNLSFKDSSGGWMVLGGSSKMSISHDPEIAIPTAGALKYDYAITKGEFSGLYMPIALGDWAKAKSVKFRVHADTATLLAIALQEQDGGRYVSMVQVPKDAWQPIELSTSDFILSQDPGDPKDPDGKLDMDRVTNIAIADVSQYFLAMDNQPLVNLLDIKKGNHAMYIDSFTVGTDPIPAGSASKGDEIQVETFVHPQLSWFSLGGIKLSRSVAAKPLEGPALRAEYHQTPGKPAVLSRALPSWILSGAKTLSFDVASVQPTKLIVQLEQIDGGKYNMVVDLPGGSVSQHKTLLLSGFARGDDSKDSDTKPHLALVKSLTLIDVTGMIDQSDHDTTLWINHIVAGG